MDVLRDTERADAGVVVVMRAKNYDQRSGDELPTRAGAYLRDLRLARKMSILGVSKVAGVTRSMITRKEAWDNHTLSMWHVRGVAKAYGQDPKALMCVLYDLWEEDNVRTR